MRFVILYGRIKWIPWKNLTFSKGCEQYVLKSCSISLYIFIYVFILPTIYSIHILFVKRYYSILDILIMFYVVTNRPTVQNGLVHILS